MVFSLACISLLSPWLDLCWDWILDLSSASSLSASCFELSASLSSYSKSFWASECLSLKSYKMLAASSFFSVSSVISLSILLTWSLRSVFTVVTAVISALALASLRADSVSTTSYKFLFSRSMLLNWSLSLLKVSSSEAISSLNPFF